MSWETIEISPPVPPICGRPFGQRRAQARPFICDILMFKSIRLESVLDPSRNSLTLVRLLAALSVIISHAFEIAVGRGAPQPLESATPFNLGQHAVNVFFVISGLTLSQALAKNPDLRRFCVARMLRIFPGLVVYGLVFTFIAGPFLTSAAWQDYWSSASTYLYPLTVLVSFAHAPPPPGLFEAVPLAGIVNEPLWTIRYEIAAYIGLALLSAFGILRVRCALFTAGLVAAALYAIVEATPSLMEAVPGVGSLTRFAMCYMVGVLAYEYRERIELSPIYLASMVPALWLLGNTPLARPVYVIFTGYLVFVLASRQLGPISIWAQRNDISYGTYLYGWPVQQSAMAIFPSMGIAANMLAGLLFAPLAGYASWKLVERRALELKSRLVRRRGD